MADDKKPDPEKADKAPKKPDPPKEPAGTARVCHQNDRAAPDGSETRWKIRCDNYGVRSTRYVIATGPADLREQVARAFFTRTEGIDAEVARLKGNGLAAPEAPNLVVTRLPD